MIYLDTLLWYFVVLQIKLVWVKISCLLLCIIQLFPSFMRDFTGAGVYIDRHRSQKRSLIFSSRFNIAVLCKPTDLNRVPCARAFWFARLVFSVLCGPEAIPSCVVWNLPNARARSQEKNRRIKLLFYNARLWKDNVANARWEEE